jgi:hypothetical protein
MINSVKLGTILKKMFNNVFTLYNDKIQIYQDFVIFISKVRL